MNDVAPLSHAEVQSLIPKHWTCGGRLYRSMAGTLFDVHLGIEDGAHPGLNFDLVIFRYGVFFSAWKE